MDLLKGGSGESAGDLERAEFIHGTKRENNSRKEM
jgi:hypothetical protein